MRLRRSDCSGPGFRRLRRGRGFSYHDPQGQRLTDPEALVRIAELAIPPAWRDVWICSDPRGHLQATGIDAAGRKQYLYHPRWREQRDRAKFERMTEFAQALPRLRRNVNRGLRDPEPTHEAVLACATRLLDIGLFRIGSEQYADEDGGVGLATIRSEHVTVSGSALVFDYPAKSGVRRVHRVEDRQCAQLVAKLKRRRGGPEELLAYRAGRRWLPVRSDEINQYLKQAIGEQFSAKDFRTWNATVLAAVVLAARADGAGTKAARQRAIKQAIVDVATVLGNTPAVARSAYIDPRVIDRYLSGWTINVNGSRSRTALENSVLDLLAAA
jgi:DNA topoisomerase IB